MKKQFKPSEIEIIDFKNDVIATSGAVTPSVVYEGGEDGEAYNLIMAEISLDSVISFFTE